MDTSNYVGQRGYSYHVNMYDTFALNGGIAYFKMGVHQQKKGTFLEKGAPWYKG